MNNRIKICKTFLFFFFSNTNSNSEKEKRKKKLDDKYEHREMKYKCFNK